jgi:hypothetical protein
VLCDRASSDSPIYVFCGEGGWVLDSGYYLRRAQYPESLFGVGQPDVSDFAFQETLLAAGEVGEILADMEHFLIGVDYPHLLSRSLLRIKWSIEAAWWRIVFPRLIDRLSAMIVRWKATKKHIYCSQLLATSQ